MKCHAFISLVLLPQLAPALGATLGTPKGDDSSISITEDKLGPHGSLKLDTLEAASQGLNAQGIAPGLLPRSFEPENETDIDRVVPHEAFSDIMPACAADDCKENLYLNEALRWVKQALKDVGVIIYETPAATTVLLIVVAVLLAKIISEGILVKAALEAVGFGLKGPIKDSFAAALQSKINPVKLGSIFSQLQSAAMTGTKVAILQSLAETAIAGLIGAGLAVLVSSSTKTIDQSAGVDPQEWRAWESQSRVDVTSNVTSQVAQFWGAPKFEGCIAYGYQQVSAPLWYIPDDMDPLTVCARTPASINGVGYKTPLSCVDEGSKKGVIGLWYVPTNGTRCIPRWSVFEDEGCMLYGRRRKFARLVGLSNNDDWKSVCNSTPAIIDGRDYDAPSYCDDKGIAGIFGIFSVADKRCECSCVRA